MEALFGSIIFLLPALVLFFFAWGQLKLILEIKSLKKAEIGDLPLNTLVKISGKASADTLLKAPGSDIDCIYFNYAIEKLKTETKIGKDGRSSERLWVLTKTGASDKPIEVTDDTGVVKIIPQGASIELKEVVSGVQVTPDFLAESSINFDYDSLSKSPHRIDVSALLDGDDIFVIGTTRQQENGVVIYKGKDEQLFISSGSELRILFRQIIKFLLLLFAGLLAVGASVFFYLNA